ncbi:MAG: bifunctional UDP-sugar hydrolase/5'-nucleotidase [Ilumatobacter sp.]
MSHSPPRTPRGAPRRTAGALALAGALGATMAAVGLPGGATAAPGDTVQILSFNDYHGHVEADTAGSIDGSFGGPAAGGGEFLAAKLTELRDASSATGKFTVAAGDNIGGSPFFSGLFRDEPSVESLNEMGLDISGVGNHEFDDGIDELLRMQNGGCFDTDDDGVIAGVGDAGTDEAEDDCFFPDAPYQGADFQWLAANVIETATGDPLDLGGTDAGGYTLRDVNGTNIAFIGMTLDGTDALVAAAGVTGYTFEDEVATANALIPEIQAVGAEAIFVLLHEGGLPAEFAIDGCDGISGPIVAINQGLDDEIDAVISGHTQQPYNCMLEGRPVVSAWEHGKVVTEMNFTLDADGDVDRDTITVVNHAVIQSELTADADVTAVIDKWKPLAEERGNDEVGRITADITRGGDPTGSDRGVESDAGNLVADAQLFAVNDAGIAADMAFMNPGGVRSDLTFEASDPETEDGVVTFGETFTFQPFNNSISVLEMTGSQIEAVLTEQCQPSDSSRPVLHLGVSDGITYDLAITTQGGVCTAIEITNLQLNGVDIIAGTTYSVAVNNFLADGGDNFDTFAEIGPEDRLPGPVDVAGLISYFEDQGSVTPPGTDRVSEDFTVLPAPPSALTGARLLDTREGESTVDGEFEGGGVLAAGETLALEVHDRGGVSSDAESVTLNVGAIDPANAGFLTLYPCSEDRPLSSSINYNGGDVVSNAVTSLVGDDGTVCIFTSQDTDLYADAAGFSAPGGSPTAVVSARLLDDRDGDANDGTVDDLFVGGGPLAGGEVLELTVAGRGGVPADAKAVILNLVAVQPADDGFLTVYPCREGEDPPLASNVNYVADSDIANGATVGIGDDGNVCIFTSQTTNLVADVSGYVGAGQSPDPVTPQRLAETRIGDDFVTFDGEFQGIGRLDAETVSEIQVAGRGEIPADTAAVSLNVATVFPDAAGFFTVFPCTEEVPLASNVNYAGDDTVANSMFVPLSDDGSVCVFSSQATDYVMDLTAALPPVGAFRPADD